MRTYEAIMVLDDRKVDDHGEAMANDVANTVTTLGGTVLEKESLGRRSFARPMGKHKAGIYWDFKVELDPSQVAVLKERYRLNEVVLRTELFSTEKMTEIKANPQSSENDITTGEQS